MATDVSSPPLDLDGDPEPHQLTARAIVAGVAVIVALLVFVTCGGCAPSLGGKRWSPATVTVSIDPAAPECAEWAVDEAWRLLKPGRPMLVRRGLGLTHGRIQVLWGVTPDYPRTLAVIEDAAAAQRRAQAEILAVIA